VHRVRFTSPRVQRVLLRPFLLFLLPVSALLLQRPASCRASTSERIAEVVAGDPLIVYGASASEAAAVQAGYARQGRPIPLVAAAEATDAQLAAADVLVFGAPGTNPFLQRCLGTSPLRLSPTAVIVGDSTFAGSDVRLVAALPNPLNPDRRCVVFAVQDEELLTGFFRGIGGVDGAGDFVVYRKSDGLYNQEDHLALGTFRRSAEGVALDSVRYWSKPPQDLSILASGQVRFHYAGFTPDEARILARYVDTMCEVTENDFGLPMPDPLHVYAYPQDIDPARIHIFTDAFDTFWCLVPGSREDFLARGNSFVAFAHETARIAFQPVIADPAKQGPLRRYDDDWSHYFQFTVLIPAVAERLGAAAWPAPLDYEQEWGRDAFARIYHGCADTYASLLLEIDRKYGRGVIGQVVRNVDPDRWPGRTGIEDFMARLAAATGDMDFQQRVAAAFPTPMEHTIGRRIQPLGFQPDLDRMMWRHRFEIVSVEAGSPAEQAGLRSGDRIVRVNGHDLDAAKARAARSLQAALRSGQKLDLLVARGGAEIPVHLEMKLR